jgi:hypothetical protein
MNWFHRLEGKDESRFTKRCYLQNNPEGGQEVDRSKMEETLDDLNLGAERVS